MNLPSVSVIIPTCDRPVLFRKALESVLAQDYENIKEIIVTDDGSGGETREIAGKFRKENGKIIYSRNSKYKKGPNGNKQNGLDLATGDFIATLDDDDLGGMEGLTWLKLWKEKSRVGLELRPAKANTIYISKGFAHGFYALEDASPMAYNTSFVYSPECDSGVLWNPIDLKWPRENPLISERDREFQSFKEFAKKKIF